MQTFEFNVPEDNDEANNQALSTQAFVPVNGENAKTASPSVSLSTDKVDLSSSTTIRVKGKDFKVPAGATVNVLFSEAEADGNPTGEALDSITLSADRVATGAFETTVNVDGTKLDADGHYAIFVTVNYADGDSERIAADYLTLTGESANKKVGLQRLFVTEVLQDRDDARGEEADHHPDDEHRDDVVQTARDGGDHQEDAECTDAGSEDDAPRVRHACRREERGEERVSHRIDRYAHTCTAIDPEDRGIGKGVAEERLHLQACDGDPCASDERGQCLR